MSLLLREITPEIRLTEDGSPTLVHPVIGESYHSSRGAIGESMHIFINNGLQRITKESVKVLEIGFGSGLNAFLTMKEERKIEYHAIELYPISLQSATAFCCEPAFIELHKAPWGEKREITPLFSLKKCHISLLDIEFDTTFDIVYFDAFSPDIQPELWSSDVFAKIYSAMEDGAILVTYSAKGVVKQALRKVGFDVKRHEGALGKHHMLIATKI